MVIIDNKFHINVFLLLNPSFSKLSRGKNRHDPNKAGVLASEQFGFSYFKIDVQPFEMVGALPNTRIRCFQCIWDLKI